MCDFKWAALDARVKIRYPGSERKLLKSDRARKRTKEHKSLKRPFQAILGLSSRTTGTIRRATVKMGPQKAKWLTRNVFLRPSADHAD